MSRLAVAGILATLVFPTAALAQSDLQGIWTNGTLTPFERPPALGTKAFFTPEEAVAHVRRNGLLLMHPLCGGIPPELAWQHLELVAKRVQPALRNST